MYHRIVTLNTAMHECIKASSHRVVRLLVNCTCICALKKTVALQSLFLYLGVSIQLVCPLSLAASAFSPGPGHFT